MDHNAGKCIYTFIIFSWEMTSLPLHQNMPITHPRLFQKAACRYSWLEVRSSWEELYYAEPPGGHLDVVIPIIM